MVTLNTKFEKLDASQFPTLNIKIIRNNIHKGFSSNHNSAFAKSCGQVFFILNPDIRLLGINDLSILINEALACEGILSPNIVDQHACSQDFVREHITPYSVFRRIFLKRKIEIMPSQTQFGMPFVWLAGMFLICKRNVFISLGGLNEKYFMYCEDYDLSARAYLQNFKIKVIKSVNVFHNSQRAIHSSIRHLYWHTISLLKVWTSVPFWKIYRLAPKINI